MVWEYPHLVGKTLEGCVLCQWPWGANSDLRPPKKNPSHLRSFRRSVLRSHLVSSRFGIHPSREDAVVSRLQDEGTKESRRSAAAIKHLSSWFSPRPGVKREDGSFGLRVFSSSRDSADPGAAEDRLPPSSSPETSLQCKNDNRAQLLRFADANIPTLLPHPQNRQSFSKITGPDSSLIHVLT